MQAAPFDATITARWSAADATLRFNELRRRGVRSSYVVNPDGGALTATRTILRCNRAPYGVLYLTAAGARATLNQCTFTLFLTQPVTIQGHPTGGRAPVLTAREINVKTYLCTVRNAKLDTILSPGTGAKKLVLDINNPVPRKGFTQAFELQGPTPT